MSKAILPVLLAVVAMGVLSVVFAQKQDAWEKRVQQVEATADSLRAIADSAELEAERLAVRADSIAQETAEKSVEIRERIRLVRDTVIVPDTCAPFVAQRDSLIDDLVVEADNWRLAYETEVGVVRTLRTANVNLRIANDSLTAVLRDRPKPRSRWLPTPGVGVFVGACQSGPCYGVGLTLSWRF